MRVDHGRDYREAQSGTTSPPAPRPVRAVEPLEHVLLLLVGQAGTLVGDLKDDSRLTGLALWWSVTRSLRLRGAGGRPLPVAERSRADRDVDRRSLWRVRQSIAHQVADDLAQPCLVAGHQRRVRGANSK